MIPVPPHRPPTDIRVQEWLLTLLRFAITLREDDRRRVHALAAALDRCGSPTAGRFNFFMRTSAEICTAIFHRNAPESDTVLRRHVSRIDDLRLAHAFTAAIGLERDSGRRAVRSKSRRTDLWRGLADQRRTAP